MLGLARKQLLHGGRLAPHDYRLARRALALIAEPIGRGGGMGRPILWRLRNTDSDEIPIPGMWTLCKEPNERMLFSHDSWEGNVDSKIITYYRVSPDKQGQSGLGLEAQRAAVMNYLNGGSWKLVQEFIEVESGKHSDRPQLAAAQAVCKKQKAKLVIAKLDRLSRNVAFIAKPGSEASA